MIPDDVVAELRARADIVAVIGEHVQLKKAGRNWKGLCPFHGEKTPSFNVSPDKGFFYCFGCQKKGDVFTFLMEFGGRTFHEAAEQLAARVGIALPYVSESPALRKSRSERAAMLDLNRAACDFFRETLSHPQHGAAGRAYLAQRGVGDAIRDRFALGFGPADWHLLTDYLRARGLDLELASKVGLVARQPRVGGYYDRYRSRLVCPVMVPGGEIVGFSARLVETPGANQGAQEAPKYINSPESPVYKKSRLLFGLAQARESLASKGRAVLVEGNFDVITLHQAGFTEVVAPLGTALTLEQVELLRRLAPRVVLLYDGDKAGYAATLHALQVCAEGGVETQVAARPGHARSRGAGPLSDGVDPDALVASGGAEILAESLDRARGGIEYFAYEVWSRARNNTDARARALADAAKLVAKVADATKRDLIASTLADAMGLDLRVVSRALGRVGETATGATGQRHPHAPATPAAPEKRAQPLPPSEELEILALLADHPKLLTSSDADRAFSLLTDPRLRDICSAARAGNPISDTAMPLLPEASLHAVLSGKYADEAAPNQVLTRLVGHLEHRSMVSGPGRVGSQLEELQTQLATAQRQGNASAMRELVQQIIAIRNSANRKQAE